MSVLKIIHQDGTVTETQGDIHIKKAPDGGYIILIGDKHLTKPTDVTPGDDTIVVDKDSVVELDYNVESEEAVTIDGGRIKVDDKFILNCKSDLNQLVPFKYNWAWNLYLSSCDNHWMPTEFNVASSKDKFNTLSSVDKSAILVPWYNHVYQNLLLTMDTTLNVYRLTTNPECRQYILRQAFELSLAKHSWMTITDALVDELTLAVHLDRGDKLLHVLMDHNQWFKDRYTMVKNMLPNIDDRAFSTNSIIGTQDFIIEMLVSYGYVNWMMHLGGYYHAFKMLGNSALNGDGTHEILKKLFRDSLTQTTYLRFLIDNLVSENQEAITDTFKARVESTFILILDMEKRGIAKPGVSEVEVLEIEKLLITEMSSFLSIFDITLTSEVSNEADIRWFQDMMVGLSSDANHDASISGGTLVF